MSDPRAAANAGRFEVRATADSHFGWIRTRPSVERTMMSWQRTAVALIGFGFAIVQYFNHLERIPGARAADRTGIYGSRADFMRRAGACHFALAVLLGGSSSVGGSFAPVAGMTKEGMNSPVIVVAILLIGIGLFAFFAVLFRLT
jgi:putative membrane protein